MIWDLGGVFLKFLGEEASQKFLGKVGVSAEKVAGFFRGEDFFRYERGEQPDEKLANEEFFQAIKRELEYKRDFPEFAADFCECAEFELDRETQELFNHLKVKHSGAMDCWMLSNMNPLHRDYIRRRWPGLFYNMSKVFLSCEMGSRKPEPEIYRRMLLQGGAEAGDCLFIDDLKINTDAAESVGIKSLLFEGADKLEIVLKAMGI